MTDFVEDEMSGIWVSLKAEICVKFPFLISWPFWVYTLYPASHHICAIFSLASIDQSDDSYLLMWL
jgi:hypothetical protein